MLMQASRVLTVDDDAALASVITLSLRKQGVESITAVDGYDALRKACCEHPDLVILDVMMPRLDGLETCRRIKQMTGIPVLMLSALTNEQDVIRGFEAGADDYLRKPFSLAELNARVRALLRSRSREPVRAQAGLLRNHDLELDLGRRRAVLGDRVLDLTPTEFRLLACLAQHAGTPVATQDLLAEVWGEGYRSQGGHLKVYICYLRRKLGDDPRRPTYIHTVRGVGYSFRAP
ncbi:MAG: response regulator transcription factor [Chloroflexi bacterium]|nr:response regulator transcription factor [Chloroflexota bacterium]